MQFLSLYFSLWLCLLSGLAFGQAYTFRDQPFMGNAVPVSSGPTYIVQDGFEETDTGGAAGSSTDGCDSSLVSAFSASKPNVDFTPALVGGQSLIVTNAQFVRWRTAGTYSEVWCYCVFQISTGIPVATCDIIDVQTDAPSTQGHVAVASNGTLRAYNGTAFGATTATMSVGVPYSVWYHWKSDGTADAEFETTATYVGSGTHFCSTSGGAGTSAVQRYVATSNVATGTNIVDTFRVATTPIGSNPP